jgi:CheY-like chemotaxis protein
LAKGNNPMSGLNILIVEDEAIIAMLLSQVVEGMGHRVCDTAATETEAVAAAARCRPDLMIVDAHLRQGSGIAAVTEILRNGFVPHIFVSGDMATARRLHEGSVVLEKPFDEFQLARAIERALQKTLAH